MPTAALKRCRCGAIGCTAHIRPAWGHARPVKRITGHKLQRLRAALFQEQPLCVQCMAEDRVTPATIRDHIVPLAEGGQDIESNCQALCQQCSDMKTQAEARRGQARN